MRKEGIFSHFIQLKENPDKSHSCFIGFLLHSDFGDMIGGHFFWMSPRDAVVRVAKAKAKAGSCLCRATRFSLLQYSGSSFTERCKCCGEGNRKEYLVFFKMSFLTLFFLFP